MSRRFALALLGSRGSALEFLNRSLDNLPLLPQRRGRLHRLRRRDSVLAAGGLAALGGAFVRLGLFFFPPALLCGVGAIVKAVVVVVGVSESEYAPFFFFFFFLPPSLLILLAPRDSRSESLRTSSRSSISSSSFSMAVSLREIWSLLPAVSGLSEVSLALMRSISARMFAIFCSLFWIFSLPLLFLGERPLVLAPVEVLQQVSLLCASSRVSSSSIPHDAPAATPPRPGPLHAAPLQLHDGFLLGHLLERAQLASFLAAEPLLRHELDGSRDDERPGRLAKLDLVPDEDRRVYARFEPALVDERAVRAATVVDEHVLAAVRELEHRVQSRGGGMLEDDVVVRGSAKSEMVAAPAVDRLNNRAVLENLEREIHG